MEVKVKRGAPVEVGVEAVGDGRTWPPLGLRRAEDVLHVLNYPMR